MFNLNVFYVLVTLSFANSKASFTPGQLAIFHASVGPCSEKLNIPDYLHLEERTEDFDPTLVDDQFKKFLLCLLSGMKLVDERGGVRRDAVMTFSEDGQDVPSLHRTLDGCMHEKGTPEEKTFHFYHCFFKEKFFTV